MPTFEYVSSAIFVYEEAAVSLLPALTDNAFGTQVEAVALADFHANPDRYTGTAEHLLVAAPLEDIKFVLGIAETLGLSVGLIPQARQKDLVRYLDLSLEPSAALEIALRKNDQAIDLIRCNGHILLFKAIVGWVPALSEQSMGFWRSLYRTLAKVLRLRMHRFRIRTAGGQTITTGASGCLVTQHHVGDVVSRLTGKVSSLHNGSIELVLTSPFSIVEYLKLLLQIFFPDLNGGKLPNGTGLIQSQSLEILTDEEVPVLIDGHIAVTTPLDCSCNQQAVRLNVGARLLDGSKQLSTKEILRVANLPHEKEIASLQRRGIPFFSHASEERFRDLFVSVRADARIDGVYVVMMFLSTLLAAVGLYLDSAAVIIGAMILAPLMTPIMSMAMGLLRGDISLQKQSISKILVGVAIALFCSAMFSLLFPHKPVTDEIAARINPTLLDLAVAILSGIAAAYAKSHREIMQNLAGVAIAVALVPPLAVAGIGIGTLNMAIFSQAFLLFLTNLIGIILAGALTFRVLGFSPVVRSKRGLLMVAISLLAIAVPLYLAYDDIVDEYVFEQRIAKDRFLVNGKYVLIRRAELGRADGGKRSLRMVLLAREPLDRQDLKRLKEKIQLYFEEDLVVQTSIRYVL
jgi:uncharacterized hydrophobic protein (TIGR00271 family)